MLLTEIRHRGWEMPAGPQRGEGDKGSGLSSSADCSPGAAGLELLGSPLSCTGLCTGLQGPLSVPLSLHCVQDLS